MFSGLGKVILNLSDKFVMVQPEFKNAQARFSLANCYASKHVNPDKPYLDQSSINHILLLYGGI